jgi:hypothetical protein
MGVVLAWRVIGRRQQQAVEKPVDSNLSRSSKNRMSDFDR